MIKWVINNCTGEMKGYRDTFMFKIKPKGEYLAVEVFAQNNDETWRVIKTLYIIGKEFAIDYCDNFGKIKKPPTLPSSQACSVHSNDILDAKINIDKMLDKIALANIDQDYGKVEYYSNELIQLSKYIQYLEKCIS